MIDMTDTIIPKSDQMNADDLIAGPRTIRISKVSRVDGAEQPIAIGFDGDGGKPFKPCKSMRRVMVHAWGADGAAYVGRSMTLYRDPAVRFGGAEVGGIRISHMTGLTKPLVMSLTETRAKRTPFRVLPLAEEAPKEPATLDTAKSTTDFLAAMEAALQAATTRGDVDAVLAHPRVVAAGDALKNGALTRFNEARGAALARTAPPIENAPEMAEDDGWPGPQVPA